MTKLSELIVWLAGVEPRQLDHHTSAAQFLVKALGITQAIVTGPIIFLAMSFFAYGSLPVEISQPWLRGLVAVTAGLAWCAIVLIGVDRTLIIVSNAVGIAQPLATKLGLLLRIGLAAIMANLFADMIIEWRYAGISNETAQHLALDLREKDAERLAVLNELPAAQEEIAALTEKSKQLTTQYRVLPKEIVAKFATAGRCETEARRLATSVARLEHNASNSNEASQSRHALFDKNTTCRKMRADATRQRTTYLRSVEAQMAKNAALLETAHEKTVAISDKVAAERAAMDRSTIAGYSSMSGRDVAFEKVKEEHPDIRLKARLWWLAFFAAELFPILLKSVLSHNSPVAAEAQADLAEGASRHRIRSQRASMVEKQYMGILSSNEVHMAIDAAAVPYAAAMEHLDGFRHLLDRLIIERQRREKIGRDFPDLAGTVHAAYAEAVANALGALFRHRTSMTPAE